MMLCYVMSYYITLYYTILYYTILYYTILYYTILYYTILYYTILYYTILYYTILYYTILHCPEYGVIYFWILAGILEKSRASRLSARGTYALLVKGIRGFPDIRGPDTDPKIVGFLLQRHPGNGPPIHRSSHALLHQIQAPFFKSSPICNWSRGRVTKCY